MNIIGRLIENRAVMFVIICFNFTQDFTAVQSAVADIRRSIRNSARLVDRLHAGLSRLVAFLFAKGAAAFVSIQTKLNSHWHPFETVFRCFKRVLLSWRVVNSNFPRC